MRTNLIGKQFGRLAVIGPAPDYVSKRGKHIGRWFARCDCGNLTRALYTADLKNGSVSSCGCLKRELVAAKNHKHGMTTEAAGSTYITWKSMRKRCNNPNDSKYPKYGAAGVTVCPEWDDFERFVSDMGHRPPGMTIDRFPDPDGNYEKANCRWATPSQQRMNQKRMIKSNLPPRPVV